MIGVGGTAERLVSNQARDRAVRGLARAYARGYMTRDEFEERTHQALTARTRADLRALTYDVSLPDADPDAA